MKKMKDALSVAIVCEVRLKELVECDLDAMRPDATRRVCDSNNNKRKTIQLT